ncbi:DUF262 domain-containing protein [Vibrio parahaemolyticus]
MGTVSLFKSDVQTTVSNSVLSSVIHEYREGSMYFDERYQRKYCWTSEDQQALMHSIFNELPLDSISVALNPESHEKYFEVIDGRQRVTTIIKYTENEFPYIDEDGNEVYFRDLSDPDRAAFRMVKLPVIELSTKNGKPLSYEQKVAYFYRKNFAGQPQSAEHKAHIEKILGIAA